MAIKEILQMRLISSFGSFRKSKSNLLLLLLYSISGLGILPLILNEGGLSEQFPIGTIMQFPILYLFPVLFLSYSLISKISVVDYEYDFVLSNQVTPKDFLLAKTLFDLSMTIFILFLPFMISFFVLIVLMKVVYVLLFCLIFLVLILSIVLENSFKVLIMFHNKKLVKVLVILLIVVMCIPVPFRIIYHNVPYLVNMISPIGSIEEIFMGWTNIYELTPMIFSILIWTSFSLFVFYKASNLNFIPYVQVVPLRAAFDTSFRYQVQRQQYLLNRMGRFSVPISLEEAPRNLILFFAKESLVRTLRFGDLFGLVIAIIFLNMPSLLTNISEGSQQAFLQQSFLTVSFVSIFFPIILTQLWITEFSDYFWIVKTSLVKTHYYIMGIFLWQLILYIPTTLILHALNALFVGSIDVQSIFISLLLSFTTSSFGVFYGIWVVKRKSFTPYVFMTGMFFFLLVALPIIVTTLVGRIFSLQSSYALVLNVIPLVYSLVSTIAFLLIADKMFRSMDI